jgi:hypothetical protein
MLKNRNAPIPNGPSFYCPITKYKSAQFASFRTICQEYGMVIRANMGMAKAKGLPTTQSEIETHVDNFFSAICRQNGWTQFLQEGGTASSSQAPFRRRNPATSSPTNRGIVASVKAVAAGSKVVIDWLASGAEAVPQEQANARAAVCSACPLNSKEELSSFFTVPVAHAIKLALEKRKGFKLSTPSDEALGVCLACECVNALKVHMPFDRFYPKMKQETKDALWDQCWIRAEYQQTLIGKIDTAIKTQ